jgi:hypothetical protein
VKTKEVIKESWKPVIIANPIYDTVFKRLMENQHIAIFFLSTILGQKIEKLTLIRCKLDEQHEEASGGKKEKDVLRYYSCLRLDFIATVYGENGKADRILIELQKSWDLMDILHFHTYPNGKYRRVHTEYGMESLPITIIYVLGTNLSEIDCPCIKIKSTYTDMRNGQPAEAKSKFMESLAHDSYIIQTGRVKDTKYTTNLDKLISIFEQRYFVADSDVTKEYRYQPDNEDMTRIIDILCEIGADPEERKQIEAEKEFMQITNKIKQSPGKELEENRKTP